MRVYPILVLAFALSSSGTGAAERAGAPSGRPALPDLTLRTQQNRPVRFYSDLIRGRSVVISFMFTSCSSVCPRTTANLLRVQKILGERVGRDVFFYSITLDPKRDKPGVLDQYARRVGATLPAWTFLTGNPADLETLRRKLGAADLDPEIDVDKTQHAALLVYGNDATGRWSMIPALADAGRIARAIQQILETDIPSGKSQK